MTAVKCMQQLLGVCKETGPTSMPDVMASDKTSSYF